MPSLNNKKNDNNSINTINEILDKIILESVNTSQYDSYYSKKAAELRSADDGCFSALAKRFLKAPPVEKEIIINLLKHFTGVEHIKFLQDFIRRESFLPRIGMLILELFNKSDAMLEDGLASRLLDLDSLTQRIKHALLHGTIDNPLTQEFIARAQSEKEGIIAQLIEETGVKLSSLIIKVRTINEKDAENIIHFVARASDKQSYALCEEVYKKTNSKDIVKLLKKMAHALKQKGIKVDLPLAEDPRDPVFKKAVLPQPRSFISTIDAEGCRIIFMFMPVTIYETKIFNIMISDLKGIHEIEIINAYRKESRVFINRLLTDKKIEFLETEAAYAAFLVEEACRITEEQGRIVSANIAQWKNIFPDLLGARKQPLIFDFISAEKLQAHAELSEKKKDLLDETDITFWFVITQEARDNWLKLSTILSSTPVLDDAQKKEKVMELIKNTVHGFFTESRKKIFRRRLEELAYFLYKRGKQEQAATAVAVACSFASQDLQSEQDLFCSEMIRRGFMFFEKTYRKGDAQLEGLLGDTNTMPSLHKFIV
ncbi:MAG: hypothetical protein WCQ99_07240 [Pseudomonadota bacterium]